MALPSSAIGQFVIGKSPIGGSPLLDFAKTIISQYENSQTLYQLISNFHDYIDPTANIQAFYDLVWNVDSAQGWGLDVWGRIVGVERVLQVAATVNLGFSKSGVSSGDSLDVAPFYNGAPLTNNYALSDDAYRILILAKALANISDGSIPGINQILLNLFPGRGNCYVTDGLDMTMTYTFTFGLTPVEDAIVNNSGVLPRPAGVQATVIQV